MTNPLPDFVTVGHQGNRLGWRIWNQLRGEGHDSWDTPRFLAIEDRTLRNYIKEACGRQSIVKVSINICESKVSFRSSSNF